MTIEAESRLMRLLEDIFADDVVDMAERAELLEFQADGLLHPSDVERIFAEFVDERWGQAMEDGVLTQHELLVLRRIVEELELRSDALPARLKQALDAR